MEATLNSRIRESWKEKCRSAEEEKQNLVENNQIMNHKIKDTIRKLKDQEELENEYRLKEADTKAAGDLNKDLEKQVVGVRIKLQNQTVVEEKCRSAEEDTQDLVQNNHILEQEIAKDQEELGE